MRNIQAVLGINVKFRPMDFELRNNQPIHDSNSNENQDERTYERILNEIGTYEAFEISYF